MSIDDILPNKSKKDQIKGKAHNMVDKVADVAETAEVKARHSAEQARVKVEETAEQVKATLDSTQSTVKEYVERKPLESIGIAFGVGLLAAALLK